MEINTYFWEGRVLNKHLHGALKTLRCKPSYYFTHGNCGDIFSRELLHHLYGENIKVNNTNSKTPRILLVGSIAHRIQGKDLICGIGAKPREIPKPHFEQKVIGLRGPISYDLFKRAGYDLSNIQFLLDPGLMLRFMISENVQSKAMPAGAIFIPHYRERYRIPTLPKDIRFCDIDAPIDAVAQQILSAELVYSSSLHGLIFAHALKRPAVLVKPNSNEAMLKYTDYYSSVALPEPSMLSSITEATPAKDSNVPYETTYTRDDFKFPTINELHALGIARN
jgi:hypothetical protein